LLVGPEARIRRVAAAEGIDLSPFELVPTRHSHEAASVAVALARAGKVEAMMKGSLHIDELMHEVVARETGLCTGRRMSHVFVMDEPDYPRLLLITDALININPDLDAKRNIVQNAIDLARAMGIEKPRVAILAAGEAVTEKLRSTLDAAALCNNAVSEEAAKAKGIVSLVAGQADILVVPDLESGDMLAKQLEYFAEAHEAGIVLGARVPIALTTHPEQPLSCIASCALALLMARQPAPIPM
jgi:phosphotransacetylase